MEKKNKNSIEEYIVEWNMKFPYDYLWRKKYNIPFGSKKHLEMDHISMVLDLSEDIQMKKIFDKKEEDQFEELDEYSFEQKINNGGDLSNRIIKMTKEEIKDEFEALDINEFN